jgi:hypothetical protein
MRDAQQEVIEHEVFQEASFYLSLSTRNLIRIIDFGSSSVRWDPHFPTFSNVDRIGRYARYVFVV